MGIGIGIGIGIAAIAGSSDGVASTDGQSVILKASRIFKHWFRSDAVGWGDFIMLLEKRL